MIAPAECQGCGHLCSGTSAGRQHDACTNNNNRSKFTPQSDALAAKLAELEGQEPVAWVEVVSTHEGPYNFEGMALLGKGNHLLYARPVPAEPVNARLLEALIQCRDRFIFYVEHHLTNGAVVKAAENDRFVTLANQAIAAAEAQQEQLLQDMHDAGREIDRVMSEAPPKAVRLTEAEVAAALKLFPQPSSLVLKITRAIETAVLRKNGIEVAE